MLKRDGHMHPNIMKFPSQGDEFIKKALEEGFDEITFTDHMPFTVTGDEHDRIPFGAVADYCKAVADHRERYSDRISIKTGIEVDFHPTCLPEIRDVLAEGRFHTVLGSSHLNIKGFKVPFPSLTRTEFAGIVLENYLHAAESGLFHVLTHLDVYRWIFADHAFPLTDDNYSVKSHESLLRRLFSELEKGQIALEVNAAPLYKKFDSLGPYPEKSILDIAADYRFPIVYGSDAHTSDRVGYGYAECLPLLRGNL